MYNKRERKQLNSDNKYLVGTALEKFYGLNTLMDYLNSATEKAYPSSNEILRDVFKEFGSLEGKKVLTVGSSGDQVLNAIYHGSKDVTLIDANIFAKFFTEYKIALIKNLDFNEFLYIFDLRILNGGMFEPKIFQRVFHDLSPEAQAFWGEIFIDQEWPYETVSRIMDYSFFKFSDFYRDENAYNNLKEKLKDAKISYIVSEFKDFPEDISDSYDIMLFSNIFDYMYSNKDLKSFRATANQLYNNHLNKNGKIHLSYSFTNKKNNTLENLFEDLSDKITRRTHNHIDYSYYLHKDITKTEKEIKDTEFETSQHN